MREIKIILLPTWHDSAYRPPLDRYEVIRTLGKQKSGWCSLIVWAVRRYMPARYLQANERHCNIEKA